MAFMLCAIPKYCLEKKMFLRAYLSIEQGPMLGTQIGVVPPPGKMFLVSKHEQITAYFIPELSTGRMDPWVGSGRVTILPDFGGSGRVGSGQHFEFLIFY